MAAPPAAGATVRAVSASYLDEPERAGVVTYRSHPFVTRSSSWNVFWSYDCGEQGMPSTWRVALRLLQRGAAHLLDSADQTSGPAALREIFHEQGAGTYAFKVTATHACTWQLRAPPVPGGGASGGG